MIDQQARPRHAQTLLILIGVWGLTLVMHGAVPFVLTPTTAQAFWSTGFSQSFANQSLLAIYATNFGAPEPAAMAFGLPGAWLTGLYLQLGMQPPDAYSAMVASWMTLALISAYGLARHFAVRPALAAFAALGWMSMPVTWAHAVFSMLSIGIALLGLYFLCAVKLLEQCAGTEGRPVHNKVLWLLAYPLVCVLALFMDGYSFMFFAVGSSLMAGARWFWADPAGRKRLILIWLPVHTLSLLAAYLLYGAFVGKTGYTPAQLDFFRGWGADLIFFAKPTMGMHWLPDALGWSETRSEQRYFGDGSTWITTFAIPVILAGIWAAWRSRAQRIMPGLLLLAGFGFYMALGPSIKLNSVKPQGEVVMGQLMPAEAALAPTGSGYLSEKLPGFNNMRASYRWTALGVFGAWALLMLVLSSRFERRTHWVAGSLMGVVILLNLPNLPAKWAHDAQNRAMFQQIEADLVNDLRDLLHQGDRVAFLPWGNDFLVNYLAARLNIVSFNIGGDKNLEAARAHWPLWMRGFPQGTVDQQFAERVVMMLASKEADAIVLPYSDMLWAAHKWPAPQKYKSQIQSVSGKLSSYDMLEVISRENFKLVRLSPESSERSENISTSKLLKQFCVPPMCLQRKGFDKTTLTQTGILNGTSLSTQGQSGFLVYGPFVEMMPGEYILTIQGKNQRPSTAWADIAYNEGQTQHGQYPLKQQNGSILLETRITLPALVRDLEVRVFVDPNDELLLDGYELRPLAPGS